MARDRHAIFSLESVVQEWLKSTQNVDKHLAFLLVAHYGGGVMPAKLSRLPEVFPLPVRVNLGRMNKNIIRPIRALLDRNGKSEGHRSEHSINLLWC